MSTNHHHFNYIELPATDLAEMKRFYGEIFDWTFIDYGPTYAAIQGAGVDGGFDADSGRESVGGNGALVVLYSNALEQTRADVEKSGGSISVAPFDFPGGRRFHFIDPSGNELAIWTTAEE